MARTAEIARKAVVAAAGIASAVLVVAVGSRGLGAAVAEAFVFVPLQAMHAFFLVGYGWTVVAAAAGRRRAEAAVAALPFAGFLAALALSFFGYRFSAPALMAFDAYVIAASTWLASRPAAA